MSEDQGPLDLAAAALLEVIAAIEGRLAAGAAVVVVWALDPDRGRGCYAGERVEHGGRSLVHRPLRVWVELADRLGLRLGTPRVLEPPLIELRFEVLARDRRAIELSSAGEDRREKYGRDSEFARICKAEEPSFVLDFADALERVAPAEDARILALGVNAGDELGLILDLRPELRARASFVGVDHSASALAHARARFPEARHRFVEADLNELGELALGRFDLVIAMSVLQSPGVDDRALLRGVVQRELGPRGAVIVGLPNCRYCDGELVHGARTRNYSQPELSLVVKNLAYYRRYLQQHRRRVFVTGRHELLLTAVVGPGQIAPRTTGKPG